MRIINASMPDFEREVEEQEVIPSTMPPIALKGAKDSPRTLAPPFT